jgi:predicted ATPase/class 3 adenylate cyclase
MAGLPSGTLTFLYTDIERSTARWEHHPDAMKAAMARHDAILRLAIEANGGHVFRTEGDAFRAVFTDPAQAVKAAAEAQNALFAEPWPTELGPLRVRMALHTGAVELHDRDYVGAPLNRIARLLSAAHGGQTLTSLPTEQLVRDNLPTGVSLLDLGEHRLKDLIHPEHVYQVSTSGLPSDFPPLNTLDNKPNNLPVQASLFVGREKELEAVCSLLRRPDVKLLTLTGPGGTGKTRLALQAAAEMIREMRDGAFFIPLAPIVDPDLVIPTVAQTLAIRESGDQTLADSLKYFIKDKQILLVLDNFEQLIEAATPVAQLLAASAQLKILVTSQVVLHVRGEQEFAVPPLGLPDPSLFSGQTANRLLPAEALAQYEAVSLFVQRARLAKPDFEITEQNAAAVVEICYRLDGLPLAIELAAARIKLLSPEAMLARLSGMAGMQNSLKLLVGGARDLPARQQALRSTIEWSYGLLGEGEKALFRRLSVFAGGCTLEAIEAVCDDGGLDIDVFNGISSLVDRSLLRSLPGREEPRFSMLRTIREYARERFEEADEGGGSEAQATRQRHAHFYLALAEREENQSPTPGHGRYSTWLDKVEPEQDNLRAVLQWALEEEQTEIALRLSGALSPFWQNSGNMSEGRRWVEAALALPDGRQHEAAYAQALVGAATLAWWQGDPATAHSWCEEGTAIYRELGDKRKLAFALVILGQNTLFTGGVTEASLLLEEGLALHRETGFKWGIAQSLFVSGQVKVAQQDFVEARSCFEESATLFKQLGDDWWAAQAINSLGDIARMQGNYEKAHTLYEESLATFRELRAKTDVPASLHNLGHLALIRGDVTEAARLFGESLSLHRENGNKPGIIESLAGLAGVEGARKHPERAVRLFSASEALRVALSATTWPAERAAYERNLAAARAQLDEDAWLEAWEQGSQMDIEQAISYALEEADHHS